MWNLLRFGQNLQIYMICSCLVKIILLKSTSVYIHPCFKLIENDHIFKKYSWVHELITCENPQVCVFGPQSTPAVLNQLKIILLRNTLYFPDAVGRVSRRVGRQGKRTGGQMREEDGWADKGRGWAGRQQEEDGQAETLWGG